MSSDGLIRATEPEMYYSRQSRAERLISVGRVLLALFSLIAIHLDASRSRLYAHITVPVLAGYLIYALIMAIAAWRLIHVSWDRFGILLHAFDLMVAFAIIMFFAEGPTSPFFVYFVFSVACATVRWQWRGTVWTTIIAFAIVISMAFYPVGAFQGAGQDMNRLFMRIIYLALVGSLLGYLGAFEQKMRRELAQLAVWPRGDYPDANELLCATLGHAAHILASKRIILLWEEGEEPWVHLCIWDKGKCDYIREPPGSFGILVAHELNGTSFICRDAGAISPVVVNTGESTLQKWKGKPLHHRLQERFNIGPVIAAHLPGNSTEGYLFVLDRNDMNADDLMLCGIVAREVADRLDHFYLLKALQQGAAAEERIRLARDLHDGTLQSLTGAALQLETVQRLIQVDPEKARQRVNEIQSLITAEQRDLRSHIQALKPASSPLERKDRPLEGRLVELAGRIERQWGLRTEVKQLYQKKKPNYSLSQEIYFIVHEGLINAARHSGASYVAVEYRFEDDRVEIVVKDDGHGFPFQGKYDHIALTAMRMGPSTLKERVLSLGGSLVIESTDGGAELQIVLPLVQKGEKYAYPSDPR
jgi:signal transduction histidine kinase